MERLEYCLTYRSADCGCVAEEDGWKDRLHWSTGVVWCLLVNWDVVVSCAVHRNYSQAEERMEGVRSTV
jgi:hypothetical protein